MVFPIMTTAHRAVDRACEFYRKRGVADDLMVGSELYFDAFLAQEWEGVSSFLARVG